MSEKKYTIFVYGTLKKGGGNDRCLKDDDVKFLGKGATAKKFKLYAHSGFPFAQHKPGPKEIKGEVYEIGEKTLMRCDRLEGHPHFYKRQRVNVTMGGKTKRAWLYFINRVPQADYVVEIRDGVFPAKYAKWKAKYEVLLKNKQQ